MKVKCETCDYNQIINYEQRCTKLNVPLRNGFVMFAFSQICGIKDRLEKVMLATFLIMLTGVPYTVTYYGVLSRAQPIVNVVIGLILFCGCFGLHLMCKSVRFKEKRRRNMVFLVGLFGLVIAVVALEGLFWEFGQG